MKTLGTTKMWFIWIIFTLQRESSIFSQHPFFITVPKVLLVHYVIIWLHSVTCSFYTNFMIPDYIPVFFSKSVMVFLSSRKQFQIFMISGSIFWSLLVVPEGEIMQFYSNSHLLNELCSCQQVKALSGIF